MKKAIKIICCVLCGIICVTLIAISVYCIRSKLIQDDYSSVYTNPKYQKALKIDDVEVIEQDQLSGLSEHAVVYENGIRYWHL